MQPSCQLRVLTDHKEVFDICIDVSVVRAKHQFLNSRVEQMRLSRDNTSLKSHGTYLQGGTNGFFVADWIAQGLTCPGGLCVFRFVCNCASTSSIPNLELSSRSSSINSSAASVDITRNFVHLRMANLFLSKNMAVQEASGSHTVQPTPRLYPRTLVYAFTVFPSEN